ncbi:MAG TPA: DoxX family protein [bacterium]|nr:DoxX family protein [bacterium]
MAAYNGHGVQVGEPPISRFLFADTRMAWFWLVVRLYAGYMWLIEGWDKLHNPVWAGPKAGTALAGFIVGAMKKTAGTHPDVTGWYANFLHSVVLPHAATWSYAVAAGELLVGLGLIVGLFTGFAAFFGGLMNANYLLAGTVSVNPLFFILATWLVLAWRIAGYYGLDQWVLPAIGVPGAPGQLFKHSSPKVRPTQAPSH